MVALRFSASRAERLIACPGSANLELSIPGFEMPEVDETAGAKGKGSNLHEWLAETGKLKASDLRKLVEALAYYSEIRSQRRFKVLAEESVEAEWLQTKPKTTVDQVLYVQDELHIIDWKTGVIQVYAEDNKQLMFYAACFLHLAPKAKGVWLHILQPDIFDRLLPIGFEVKSNGSHDDPSSEIENSLLIHIGWVEHVHHCRAQWSPLVPT